MSADNNASIQLAMLRRQLDLMTQQMTQMQAHLPMLIPSNHRDWVHDGTTGGPPIALLSQPGACARPVTDKDAINEDPSPPVWDPDIVTSPGEPCRTGEEGEVLLRWVRL
jgi:hypothetical protein